MTRQLTIAALKAELAGRDQTLLNQQAQVRALEAERDALRDEEAGQRGFLETMAVDVPIPIVVIDGETRVTKWSNPAWQRLMSGDSEPALPDLVEITTRARPVEVATRMARSGPPFYQGEFEFKPPQADASYWRCTFLLLPAGRRRSSDVMILATDITARKSIEESLRQTRDTIQDEAVRLERRVSERTAELETLNAALRAEIELREKVEEAHLSQAIRLREQADLLDLAPDAILVRDWGNRIRFWNAGAAEVYGWPATDVAGRNVYALIPLA
jgi:PAS domain-containing protein